MVKGGGGEGRGGEGMVKGGRGEGRVWLREGEGRGGYG